MPRRTHSPEEIVAKLRQVDALTSSGRSIAEAVRTIGVTEVTYRKWRSEYGGLLRVLLPRQARASREDQSSRINLSAWPLKSGAELSERRPS